MISQTFRKGRRYSLSITQNDYIKLRATLHDDAGDPIDLTSGTVVLYGVLDVTDGTPTLSITGTVVNASLGIVDFILTSTHTQNVRDFRAEIELQGVESTGINETFIKFDLGVTPDVG